LGGNHLYSTKREQISKVSFFHVAHTATPELLQPMAQ
jgi:hypothetical protein